MKLKEFTTPTQYIRCPVCGTFLKTQAFRYSSDPLQPYPIPATNCPDAQNKKIVCPICNTRFKLHYLYQKPIPTKPIIDLPNENIFDLTDNPDQLFNIKKYPVIINMDLSTGYSDIFTVNSEKATIDATFNAISTDITISPQTEIILQQSVDKTVWHIVSSWTGTTEVIIFETISVIGRYWRIYFDVRNGNRLGADIKVAEVR